MFARQGPFKRIAPLGKMNTPETAPPFSARVFSCEPFPHLHRKTPPTYIDGEITERQSLPTYFLKAETATIPSWPSFKRTQQCKSIISQWVLLRRVWQHIFQLTDLSSYHHAEVDTKKKKKTHPNISQPTRMIHRCTSSVTRVKSSVLSTFMTMFSCKMIKNLVRPNRDLDLTDLRKKSVRIQRRIWPSSIHQQPPPTLPT